MSSRYTVLIRNARIVDGTGAPAFSGDIGIAGSHIVALGRQLEGDAEQVINASGLTVAPGFIDAHTHDDLVVLRQSVVPPKLYQGVTSLVIGNCGFGMAPVVQEHEAAVKTYSSAILGEDSLPWNWPTVGAYLETMRSTALKQHVCSLLPHGPLRVAVMGYGQRQATEREIQAQEALVEEAMQAGSAGLSLGLMYVPGMYTPASELTRLARVVGRYGGVVTSHMRGEGDHLFASIAEMLELGEKADVAIHISHLKVCGRHNWGGMERALEMITAARARGLDVSIDMYPYTNGSTTILQLLPPWVLDGGIERTLERLRDPSSRRRVSLDLQTGVEGWENQIGYIGWEGVRIASVQSEGYKGLEEKNMLEVADLLQLAPDEALFELILHERGKVTVLLQLMSRADIDRAALAPFAMLGSDGIPLPGGRPHPRLYGTFPRFLARYVRERKLLSLEEAIHKLTLLPARRFRLSEHGEIAPGKVADLVLFDEEAISDTATYNEPRRYPVGIEAVLVAGRPVLWQGQEHAIYAGRLLTPERMKI
uniref:Dihydroorotase n=1 Tax=Thermosporothrix sp. COM3 TaxID=2490863 RepID=A0A455SHR1_9CHLR|nr:dihydroorotase [Thermosporothrix sp. COM3]